MIQLRILSGKHAGATHAVSRFPCVIGRGAAADFRLEEPGVWDKHLQLDLKRGEAVIAKSLPGALARVNSQPFDCVALRTGDVIELGATQLQFWLSPSRQRSFRAGEILTWITLAMLCLAQIVVIYGLQR
jgi:hypothetical protein